MTAKRNDGFSQVTAKRNGFVSSDNVLRVN